MAQEIQIKCIVKSDRQNIHERITRIGGTNPDGSYWSLTQQDAIHYIENKTYDFYVKQSNSKVAVVVAVSRFNHKYIKTVSDGEEPNNLLSLPSCPN